METSSSSKQRARAPFSFHCTICYDAFNLTDRAPVVLPCGHTYICEPCCKRLDKCMECRTPLVMKIHTDNKPGEMMDQYTRYGHAPGLSPRPIPAHGPLSQTVPVPVPKNHVLMCLIDAAQKSTEKDRDDEGYESGEDDELVLRGMKVLGSTSGTYVVREKKGLIVYPFPPKNGAAIPNKAGAKTLKYGQSVQIFRYENKIATVARGAGYILVDNTSQLVKVGEVTDEGCKLEATRKVIEKEIEGLENKIAKLKYSLDNVEKKLTDLSDSNNIDSVFGPVPEEIATDDLVSCTAASASHDNIRGPLCLPAQPQSAKKSILKKEPPPIAETQSYEENPTSIFCAPALEPSRSFENLARYIRGEQEEERQSMNAMSQYFSTYWSGSRDEADTRSVNSHSSSTSVSQYSGVDFVSGLSGHVGLSRARSISSRQQRKVMMMSHY